MKFRLLRYETEISSADLRKLVKNYVEDKLTNDADYLDSLKSVCKDQNEIDLTIESNVDSLSDALYDEAYEDLDLLINHLMYDKCLTNVETQLKAISNDFEIALKSTNELHFMIDEKIDDKQIISILEANHYQLVKFIIDNSMSLASIALKPTPELDFYTLEVDANKLYKDLPMVMKLNYNLF